MPFVNHNGQNILFIHIPKTGGTTVETWLSTLGTLRFRTVGVPGATRCSPQHFRLCDFRHLFGKDFFDYSFMIVRNPYDRIASEYRMRATEQGAGFWKAWPTFSSWLEIQLERSKKEPWALDNHLRPQWEFTGNGLEIFRLEDGMQGILSKVAERLGVPAPSELPWEMRSDGFAGTVEWDHLDRLRVQEAYARDFKEFGYEP
jgi:hypothetical protein